MGDFNKDTNLDVVLANTKSGTLVTLLGNGNGTFRSPVVSQGFATAQFAMVVGDFNRDGLPDLVVTDGETTFQTAFGNGNGSFRAGSPFTATSPFTTALLSADITGDGKLDLIVATDGFAASGGCCSRITRSMSCRAMVTELSAPEKAIPLAVYLLPPSSAISMATASRTS